jgi:hypothetical protein
MPALDEQGLRNARELAQKATKFVADTVKNGQGLVDHTGQVQSRLAYVYFCEHATHMKGVVDQWKKILEDHYGALTYGLVPPTCRAWLWASHPNIQQALGLGLCLERVLIERRLHMTHGTGSTPRAQLVLSPEATLFASDGQFYGVDQRDVLKVWLAQWRDTIWKQAKPLLIKQFEF